MVKMNNIIMIAVLAMAVVAFAGVASAKMTTEVNTIQTNGVYVGTPTLLNNMPGLYGYTYTFNPDGTYTIYGTLSNDDNTTALNAWAYAESTIDDLSVDVTVPAAVDHFYTEGTHAEEKVYAYTTPSKADFSITISALNNKDIDVWTGIYPDYDGTIADLSNVDYIDAPQSTHTIDQGPMSNMVALYTNGKINFNNSPLYSFVS